MPDPMSLLEFIELLSGDDQTRSEFTADPDATLSAYGLDNLGHDDVRDAILLAQDTHTVDWSAAYGAGDGTHRADEAAFGAGWGPAGSDGLDHLGDHLGDRHGGDHGAPYDLAPDPASGTPAQQPDMTRPDDITDPHDPPGTEIGAGHDAALDAALHDVDDLDLH